jgi:hypothetical protein
MIFKTNANEFEIENKTLLNTDMVSILARQNNANRDLSCGLVDKISSSVKECKWCFEFLEGKTLYVDKSNGELLSGQHRLNAMVNNNLQSWSVVIQYVDKDWWLVTSNEKRSSVDKTTMASRRKFSGKQAACVVACNGQIKAVTSGYSTTSGASGKNKMTEEDMVVMYGDSIEECWNLIPALIRQNDQLCRSIILLYICGYLTKSQIKSLINPESRLYKACEWLISEKEYGYAIKQLAYGVACIKHAMSTTRNTKDYSKIDEKYKPQYVKTGKYIFSDFS